MWRQPPSSISINICFWLSTCVLFQILNIPTKFGEDWSYSEKMVTNFRNSRWRRQPSLISVNVHFDMTVAFYGRFSTFPSNLVRIGPIIEEWQHIFKIRDGDGCHLEFGWICNFDMTVAFFALTKTITIPVTLFGYRPSFALSFNFQCENIRSQFNQQHWVYYYVCCLVCFRSSVSSNEPFSVRSKCFRSMRQNADAHRLQVFISLFFVNSYTVRVFCI